MPPRTGHCNVFTLISVVLSTTIIAVLAYTGIIVLQQKPTNIHQVFFYACSVVSMTMMNVNLRLNDNLRYVNQRRKTFTSNALAWWFQHLPYTSCPQCPPPSHQYPLLCQYPSPQEPTQPTEFLTKYRISDLCYDYNSAAFACIFTEWRGGEALWGWGRGTVAQGTSSSLWLMTSPSMTIREGRS